MIHRGDMVRDLKAVLRRYGFCEEAVDDVIDIICKKPRDTDVKEPSYEAVWRNAPEKYKVIFANAMDDVRRDPVSFVGDMQNELRANATQIGGTHYKDMKVEPWDVVDTWPLEQRIGAYRHGALKYIMRMGSKDQSAQEIAKGKHYMEKLLEVLNEEAK